MADYYSNEETTCIMPHLNVDQRGSQNIKRDFALQSFSVLGKILSE